LISGYTRVAALKYLGKKTCDCRVLDIPEKEQVFYLISSNKQRVKDYVCRMAEIDALEAYYVKGQGYRSDLHSAEPVPSTGTRRPPARNGDEVRLSINLCRARKMTNSLTM